MGYQYKIIAFVAEVKVKGDTVDVGKAADQLSSALAREMVDGWELYSVSTIWVQAKPGCLGAFLGQKVTHIPANQLIFRRPE